MRRCYLHFGTPKTGSTAFQQFLHQHRTILARRGLFVPTVGTGPGGGQHPLVKAIAKAPVLRKFVDSPRELPVELAAFPDCDVVITAEWLMSNFRKNPADNSIVRYFRDLGYQVVLLGYFRNQPQFVSSIHAQSIKALLNIPLETHAEGLDHTVWLDFAPANGCEFLARPFNKAVRQGGIVDDFLKTVGIELQADEYKADERVNRSPGPCLIAALLEITQRSRKQGHRWTEPQRIKVRRLLADIMEEPQFSERPYCALDTSTARRIQSSYAASNDRFARAVWGTDWASVFKEDVEAEFQRNVFDPVTASAETRELHAAVLERLWAGMEAIMNDPRLQTERALVVADRHS